MYILILLYLNHSVLNEYKNTVKLYYFSGKEFIRTKRCILNYRYIGLRDFILNINGNKRGCILLPKSYFYYGIT